MNTLRLLLIEDCEDDAFLLIDELERAGYELTSMRVQNEGGLIEALYGQEWDLVICDYALPGFSGPAALDLVRQCDADLPFIVVSGTIGEETAVEVMRAGANDYVLKGRLGRLAPAVARALREAASRRERRYLMSEVLRSEERFRATFEHAPIGITHGSGDGVLLRVNQQFCRLTGWSTEELVGHSVASVSHSADREMLLESHRRISSGAAEVESFESRYTRKDGSVLWANVTLAAVRDEEGCLRHVIGLFEDVTERRTTREQLRFHARLLECVEQAVVATDLRGRVQYWNRHAEELYGIPAAEAMNRRVLDLVRPVVSREEVDSLMTRVRGGHTWSREIVVIGRKGALPVTLTNCPVTDAAGTVIGVVAVSQDVTERRAAEQALHASRAQLALAQHFTRVGSAEYDYATGRRAWSDEMFRLWGLEPRSEPPSLEELLTLVEEEDRDALALVMHHAIERMEGYVLDYRVRLPDGRPRMLRSQARVITGPGGEPVKLLGIVQDVTEQKALEEEMLRHSERHEAIANFSQSALGGSAIEDLFRWANLLVRTIGKADFCKIAQLTEGSLLLVSGDGWSPDAVGQMIEVDDSLAAGHALVSLEAVVVEDFESDDRFGRSDLLERHRVRSGVTVPIPGKDGQSWGVLGAHCACARAYSANEVNFLRALANILGYAIQRKHNEEELRGLAAQQAAIAELGSRAVSAVDDEIVEHACTVLRRVLATEHSCFLLYHAETGFFSPAGGNDWAPAGYRIPGGPTSHAGYTLCADEPVVVHDYNSESRFTLASLIADHGLVSGAAVPVKGGSRTYGVLAVQTREPRTFSARDIDFLQSIGNIVADVLERETARRALLESETRYRSVSHELQLLLESAEEGIYAVERDGTCRMANPAAARLLGYAQHELIGRNLHELIHSRRPDGSPYPDEECPLGGVARTGASCRSITETFWRRDGSALTVEYSAAPIIDGGDIAGVVVTFTDVTERRKLESQLEQANRLTSLGHLAATIAHEFNNVLMGISPFVELLTRSAEQTPQLRLATDQMSKSIRRGKGVTSEILRFTRARPPVLETVRVSDWLHSLAMEATSVLGDLYDVEMSIDPADLAISADADQLHQVFLNLIVNARDAMPGGGRLSITARRDGANARYSFGVVPESERFIHFTVADSGSGMSRDMLTHIFEPLYTTKRNGTGLGLAVTHQVINRHGGHIFVESTLGMGTTFHLFVLLATAQESARLPALSAPQHAAVARVLLVEDEEAVAAGMATLLELHGIAVSTIGTAAAVLDAIDGDDPDAVILDIGLPDGDGTQVYPAIAKMYPRLPVIFSTGHGDEQKLEPFLTNVNVRFLMKPYEIEALLDVLNSVIPARAGSFVN